MSFGIVALVRRFVVGLAGEGLQSGFHFALNVVLMRHLPAYDYGLFAIVFTLGSLGLTYTNALVATPAAVNIPRFRSPGAAAFQDVVLGSVAGVLAVVVALLVAIGMAVWEGSATLAIAGGVFVGAWSIRNYVRVAQFAKREPFRAVRSDLVFAAVGTACLIARQPFEAGAQGLAEALAILTVANIAGIAVGLFGPGRRTTVSLRPSIWRRYRTHWRQVSWSLAGVTTANVQATFQTLMVTVISGPAAYAPIAAALVLVAPLRLGTSALIWMVQPEFASALAGRDLGRVRHLLAASAALVLLVCLTYGAALWAAFGLIDAQLFGASFSDEPMRVITALAWGTSLVFLSYSLPKALMEAAGEFKAVAGATLVSVLVGIVVVAVLLVLVGPAWSLAGVIAAEVVTLAHFWRHALGIVGVFRVAAPALA